MSVKHQVRAEQNMVGKLLAERFNLRMHHETRQLRVYALGLAHNGSKIRSSISVSADEQNEADGPPGNWTAKGMTIKAFTRQLGSLPEMGGKVVVDRTDLKGSFNFALRWTPDTMAATAPSYDESLKLDSAPSLRTALVEQLGLRLEMTKAPVDVVVIDAVDQPSSN